MKRAPKSPKLTVLPGQKDELEQKAVQMIFTPGPLSGEWNRFISRLSHRAKLSLAFAKDRGER